MKLLAIDTCADQCAACVLDTGDGTAHEVSRAMSKGHAEQLMDVIGECLVAAEIGFDGLERVAVTVGPGSFTGVRVGVAAARGLALALGVPCVGVSTLEALAAAARAYHPGRPVLAANDARREEIYAALYDGDGIEVGPPHITTVSAAAATVTADMVLAGSASDDLAASGAAPLAVAITAAAPPIRFVAALGALKSEGAEKPKPLYLRAPDARPQAGFSLPRKAG